MKKIVFNLSFKNQLEKPDGWMKRRKKDYARGNKIPGDTEL